MKDVFTDVDIEITAENKRDVDRVIHQLVGVEYKKCPEAWRAVKVKLAEDRDGFIKSLKTALAMI